MLPTRWTEVADDEFYVCPIIDDAASLDAAQMAPDTTDSGNLENGCHGQPWRRLYRAISARGLWTDGEATFYIGHGTWDDQSIIEYSNRAGLVVTENASGAGPDALLYNMIAWQLLDDSMAYCVVSEDQPTVDAAQSQAVVADPEDLEEGCDGAPWTVMVPAEAAGDQ